MTSRICSTVSPIVLSESAADQSSFRLTLLVATPRVHHDCRSCRFCIENGLPESVGPASVRRISRIADIEHERNVVVLSLLGYHVSPRRPPQPGGAAITNE